MPESSNRYSHRADCEMRAGRRHHTSISWAVAIGAWICGAALFFRAQWLSGFDLVSGRPDDARLNIYLHEHLFRWLRGLESLTSPSFFYPQPGVLGYGDAFALDLPTYVLLRAVGIDAALSHQLMLVLLSFVGYITFIGVLRYAFAIRYSLAIAAGLLFIFSNIMFLHQLRPQLFAVYYLPGILLLTLWSLKDFPRVTMRLVGGVAAAALLYALLFSTAYYVAWSVGVLAVLGTVPVVALLRKQLVPIVLLHRRPLIAVMTAGLAGFAIGLIPFTTIYGPMIQAGIGRGYHEALFYAPLPQDIINVSPWNLVWGGLLSRMPDGVGQHFARWEATASVTPAVAVATLISASYVWRGRLINWACEPCTATAVVAAAFLFLISWLLICRFGRYSGYWLIWHLVPGASGIRIPWRIALVVNALMIAALAVVLDRVLIASARRWPKAGARSEIVVSLFLAYCVVEQINTFPAAVISRSREWQNLAAIPPAPADCKAFFVEPVAGAYVFDTQVSAMLISQRIALPTLNGYSGILPPGWSLNRGDLDYHESVRSWMALHRLSGNICSLTLPQGPWRLF